MIPAVRTDVTEDRSYGAELDNTFGTTAGITIINNTIPAGPPATYRDFSMNTAGGLELRTKGAVIITNTILEDNGGYGVEIDNDETIPPYTYATNVTLTGVYANENYWSGIWVINKGSITLTNVASWDQSVADAHGAYLDNNAGTGNVTIKNTIAMPFGFRWQPWAGARDMAQMGLYLSQM